MAFMIASTSYGAVPSRDSITPRKNDPLANAASVLSATVNDIVTAINFKADYQAEIQYNPQTSKITFKKLIKREKPKLQESPSITRITRARSLSVSTPEPPFTARPVPDDNRLQTSEEIIAKAISFFINYREALVEIKKDNKSTKINFFYSAHEKTQTLNNIIIAIEQLVSNKIYSININQHRMTLLEVISTIESIAWCSETINSQREITNSLSKIKIIIGKLINVPTSLLTIREKKLLEMINNDNSEGMKKNLTIKLFQRLVEEYDSADAISKGFVSISDLIHAYPILMTSEVLFDYILYALEQNELEQPQKLNLVKFCNEWLTDEDNVAETNKSAALLNKIKSISKIASSDENYCVSEHGMLLINQLKIFDAVPSESSNHLPEIAKLEDSSHPADPFSKECMLHEIPSSKADDYEEMLGIYAQQFAQLSKRVFLEISIKQWLKYKSTNEDETSISKAIEVFNRMSRFVAQSVLTSSIADTKNDVLFKDRYYFYIQLAWSLLQKGDIYSAMAIFAALQSSSISAIFDKCDNKSDDQKDCKRIATQLADVFSMNSNYTKLREFCEKKGENVTPYIGLILQDLTFILENQDTVTNPITGLNEYNTDKLTKIGKLLRQLSLYKNSLSRAPLQPMSTLERRILNSKVKTQDNDGLDKLRHVFFT